MPATAQELNALVAVMFNAAPGGETFDALNAMATGGADLTDIANFLASRPVFASQFAGRSALEAVEYLVTEHLGIAEGTDAFDPARSFIHNQIVVEGQSVGQTLATVTSYLLGGSVAEMFETAAAILTNKAAVSAFFNTEEDDPPTSLDGRQAVLAGVDETDASVEAVKAEIRAGMHSDGGSGGGAVSDTGDAFMLSAPAASVTEGDDLTFTVSTADGEAVDADTDLTYRLSGVDDDDVESLTGTVQIEEGESSATFTVTLLDDEADEGDGETMTVSVDDDDDDTEDPSIEITVEDGTGDGDDDADDAPAGATITLTTGADTKTGGSEDTLFRTTETDSLNTTDVLDGGAGSDTLEVHARGLEDGAKPTLQNIETLVIYDSDGDTLDLADASGVTTVWFDGREEEGNGITFDNAPIGFTYGVQDIRTDEQVTVNLDNPGDADDPTLSLTTSNIAEGATATITDTDATHDNDIDAVSITTVEDSAGQLDIRFFNAFTTLSITGEGDLTLSALTSDVLATISAGDASGDLTITSDSPEDMTVTLGAGDDTLTLSSDGDMTVSGGDGRDTLETGSGDDSIDGGAHGDELTGGAGNDTLSGGDGNDEIFVNGDGTDADQATGGAGADAFVMSGPLGAALAAGEDIDSYTGRDLITDFNTGDGDRLILSDGTYERLGTAGNIDSPGNLDAGVYVEVELADTNATIEQLETAANAQGAREDNPNLIAASIGDDTYLFYDADGHANGGNVSLVAILQGTDTDALTADDIGIIA